MADRMTGNTYKRRTPVLGAGVRMLGLATVGSGRGLDPHLQLADRGRVRVSRPPGGGLVLHPSILHPPARWDRNGGNMVIGGRSVQIGRRQLAVVPGDIGEVVELGP